MAGFPDTQPGSKLYQDSVFIGRFVNLLNSTVPSVVVSGDDRLARRTSCRPCIYFSSGMALISEHCRKYWGRDFSNQLSFGRWEPRSTNPIQIRYELDIIFKPSY